MIIPALGQLLLNNYPPDSLAARSPKRLEALEFIRSIVGESVWWSRQAEHRGDAAIQLRTISHLTQYTLDAELGTTQPEIQVDVFAKGPTMNPWMCTKLTCACRLAFSNYRGWLWDFNQDRVYVHGLTLLREQMDPAQYPVEYGEYWAFRSGFDIRVTYDREVIEGECHGMHGQRCDTY